MMRRAIMAVAAAAALTSLAAAGPAFADNSTVLPGSSALVRGGAVLPRFTTTLPLEIGNPDPMGASKRDLEISLTQPDHSVLRFLFSPRSIAGQASGVGTTAGSSFAGLAWNIFDNDRLFGTFALSTTVSHPLNDDPTRRLYGPLISLHSTFELGYAFDPRQSLSLDLEHANPAPFMGDRYSFGSYGENLRLQYGLHF
jgi:hypothetical protein